MKKLFLFVASLFLSLIIYAQSNAVDEMFNKYSEKDGFTVVSISSKMFSLFSDQETGNEETENVTSRLKSIRILSVDDSLMNRDLNFYTELGKRLDLSVYEELMVIKEGKDVTKFLIRQKGSIISELLVIAGGPGGNSLISIKGDLNLKDISDISKSTGIHELEGLENIEQKKPEK